MLFNFAINGNCFGVCLHFWDRYIYWLEIKNRFKEDIKMTADETGEKVLKIGSKCATWNCEGRLIKDSKLTLKCSVCGRSYWDIKK
jgi:hypothetical protein